MDDRRSYAGQAGTRLIQWAVGPTIDAGLFGPPIGRLEESRIMFETKVCARSSVWIELLPPEQ